MLAAVLAATIASVPAPSAVSARIDRLGAVSTMIDGKGPFHFLVDTGAGITVITPQCARRLGLAGSGVLHATGVGARMSVQRVTLRSVGVADALETNVAAAIIPMPPDVTYQGDYGTIDGMLGYSFLARYAVTVDLRDHRLTLTAPTAYHKPRRAVAVSADLSRGTPVVHARVDGIPGAFQLDTGDDGDLTLTAAFTAAHRFAERYPRRVPVMFAGVGGMQRGADVRVHRFAIGGAEVRNEITTLSFAKTGVLADRALAGNVGVDVLRRFVFTIDYPRSRVDFTPNALLDAYVPEHSTGAIATRLADGGFRVIAVVPDSPASRAGIIAGDVLVKINGYPLAALDIAQLREALRANRVSYTIRRAHRDRVVTLRLTDRLPRP